MTSPYGRMPMVAASRPPFDAVAEHAVVTSGGWAFASTEGRSLPRSGGSSNRRAVVAFPD